MPAAPDPIVNVARIVPRKDRNGNPTGEYDLAVGPEGEESWIARVYDALPYPWTVQALAAAPAMLGMVQYLLSLVDHGSLEIGYGDRSATADDLRKMRARMVALGFAPTLAE